MNFSNNQILGVSKVASGHYSTVYGGDDVNTHEHVAIKVVKSTASREVRLFIFI